MLALLRTRHLMLPLDREEFGGLHSSESISLNLELQLKRKFLGKCKFHRGTSEGNELVL